MAGKETIILRYDENKSPTVSRDTTLHYSDHFLSYATLSRKPDFASEYEILDIYVFLPDHFNHEKAIYYVTNHGTFVQIFDGNFENERSRIYPQEEVLNAYTRYREHLKQTEGILASPPDFITYFKYILGTEWDRGAVLVKNQTLPYSVLSAVGGFILGAAVVSVAAVLCVRIKKKRAQANIPTGKEGGST